MKSSNNFNLYHIKFQILRFHQFIIYYVNNYVYDSNILNNIILLIYHPTYQSTNINYKYLIQPA
jgi:hypothetical protein